MTNRGIMKILTIAGTRPELIRLSIIIEKLDKLVDHVFVYTNQNYTASLKDKFFEDLSIRKPDYTFEVVPSFALFLAQGFVEFDRILTDEKPDKVLILGDTNSGLMALIASKHNIPIYHMEAGNRCRDKRVPEETNRKIIDNLATYNLPYTENSRQNLLAEGFHKNYVLKTGNPILEVMSKNSSRIEESKILDTLGLETKEYVLVTMHRAENVDNMESLSAIVKAINYMAFSYKVVVSVHPRTKDKIKKYNLTFAEHNVIVCEPFSFFDFVYLENNAKLVVSDSGTVQEECCIMGVPSLTIRKSTERHETIECGSNVLTGTSYDSIITAFNVVIERDLAWAPPEDYLVRNVSDIVINILLGD